MTVHASRFVREVRVETAFDVLVRARELSGAGKAFQAADHAAVGQLLESGSRGGHAFTSTRSGSPQIHLMNADGANVRRLTFEGDFHDEATWSQDGTRIACTTKVGGRFQLATVDVIDGQLLITDVFLVEQTSTGIGGGVGIPHGKLKDLENLLLGFGLSRSGVEFESMDSKPTYIFFLLLTPENSTGLHLKLLARISRLLKNESFKEKLLGASDRDEIYRVIEEEDEEF